MKYDLAQTLKEAGFPLDEGGMFFEKPDGEAHWFSEPPSLSELIRECGEGFAQLYKFSDEFEAYGGQLLNAKDGIYSIGVQGKSPEEAVAKLWLELFTKKLTPNNRQE